MRPERQERPAANRALSNVTDKARLRRATVRLDGDTIRITGSEIFATLRPANFRAVFCGSPTPSWFVDRRRRGVDRLPDLLAVLDAAGYKVTVVDGGGC